MLLLLGNDNEAKCDLIISRLPNRFEQKNNGKCNRREIFSRHCAKRKSITAKLKSSMTVSKSGWWCGYWQPSGDQGLIHTSARHQSCTKTWKHSQSPRLREFECSSKNKTTDNPLSCRKFLSNLLSLEF